MKTIHEAEAALKETLAQWRSAQKQAWEDRCAAEMRGIAGLGESLAVKHAIVAEALQAHLLEIVTQKFSRWSGGQSITNLLEQERHDMAADLLGDLRFSSISIVTTMIAAAEARHVQRKEA